MSDACRHTKKIQEQKVSLDGKVCDRKKCMLHNGLDRELNDTKGIRCVRYAFGDEPLSFVSDMPSMQPLWFSSCRF